MHFAVSEPLLEDNRLGPPHTIRALAMLAAVGFGITFVGGVMVTAGISRAVSVPLIVLGLFVSLGMGIGAAVAQHRRERLMTLADEMERAGYAPRFRHGSKPDASLTALALPFANLPELRSGLRGVVWGASRDEPREETRVIAHEYVRHDGQTTSVLKHVAASRPAAPGWPALRVTTENLGGKLARALGRHTIRLDDPAFNDRFRVECADERFAVILLTPEIQRWLAETASKHETWHVADGWLTCLRRVRLPADEALPLAGRVEAFEGMIEPLVFEYGRA